MGQGFTSTALAALMIGVATPVIAQSSDVARRFEIAAGPLDRSLPEFARQSGLQILYPSALVAGRQSPAVNGDLTSEVALTLLLRDSGLTYRQSRPTVFVLVDPSARAEVSGVEAVELDEVVVTGTYLRGADSPSPVTVITQADVARQGRATVAETLAAMPQNFTGAAYEGSANTGADRSGRNIGSATGVNLRGLGADATLVLVNGRRVAGTGSAGDFADISNIPSSAISRADVLLDGASALYGADAVGGVVNIILRSRFEGAETRVRVGGTSDGGSEEFLFSHGGGLSWGSGSIVAAYEYHDRSELQGADRDATADADLRRFGGTDRRLLTASPGNIVRLDAATATYIPLFAIPSGQNGIGLAPGEFLAGRINRTNQLEGQWFLPDQKRQSVFLAARQNLPAGFSLDGDVRYTERDFFLKTSADAGTFTVTAANPYFVSPNGSTSHDIAFSWVNDLGPGVSEGSSESVGGAIGVSGELLGWNVSAYASGAQETTDRRLSNRVQTTFLQEALGARADLPTTTFRTATDGFFNPFGGPAANSATILAHIGSGYTDTDYVSTVSSFNVKTDGTVFELPGGPLQAAFGLDFRAERFESGGESFLSGTAPRVTAPISFERDVSSAFAEVRVPIFGSANARPGLERLELSLAGRVEDHEGVGRTRNPKLGVLYGPTPDLVLRASWGTSFRAPSLRELQSAYRRQTDPMGESATEVVGDGGRLCRVFADVQAQPPACVAARPGASVSWERRVSVGIGSEGRQLNQLEVRSDAGSEVVRRLNPELDTVFVPEARLITGPDGARGWLFLPEANSGQPPPVIVIPYPGATYPTAPVKMRPEMVQMTQNGGLLVAAGYAVIYPDLPTNAEPSVGIADRILAVVDAAAADGSIDARRIGLWGHSFGGWSVMMSAAQSPRFSAVVALNGPYNLQLSLADMAQSQRILGGNTIDAVSGARWLETGQAGMLRPYWTDPERYRRGSPFEQADRIRTPILLFHGELDFLGFHTEQMYAALVRLHRPVALTYLFGEDHSVHNPGNARVYYDQLTAWFDQYLRPDERRSGPSTAEARLRSAPG